MMTCVFSWLARRGNGMVPIAGSVCGAVIRLGRVAITA